MLMLVALADDKETVQIYVEGVGWEIKKSIRTYILWTYFKRNMSSLPILDIGYTDVSFSDYKHILNHMFIKV
jgi:hypothetical protein